MIKFTNPAAVHSPIAFYSHQAEVLSPVRWLVVSGQLGQALDGSVSDDPIRQLDLAFENVTHNLHAAQMDVNDLVKLTIYLVGQVDVERRRTVIVSHLKAHRPCVTMVFVAALADPKFKVEIEAWACRAV
jgi:enamine deaminase RidA (YjgF/YER057c/UK114 family)